MKTKYLLLMSLLPCFGSMDALELGVWTMNNTDKVLKIQSKADGAMVDPGAIDGWKYNFEITPGLYEFSLYESDGVSFIGAIDVEVEDKADQTLMFYSGSYIVTNTHADGSKWVEGVDYTLNASLQTSAGEPRTVRMGHNSYGDLSVFLRAGDNLVATATPSEENKAAGYLAVSGRRAATNNTSLSLTIPKGVTSNITLPADAELQIGTKSSHFVDFSLIEPTEEKLNGDTKTLTYTLLPNTQINYRTWRKGGLTRAGYFTSAKNETETVDIEFSEEDYNAFDPKAFNLDVKSNSGYETGDIFVNGNERGHIELAVGDTFKAHAMRTWQLTNNSTANYFMEPDFHYEVVGLDGQPLNGVIDITSKPGSAWADIKALASGTAIVLVTYDAIGVDYYSNGERTPFMGGEIWGAIWPENTAAYIVTVGAAASSVEPNMFVNEELNSGALKVAGKNVDAEHDVFYFLDTEDGYDYTFNPENVSEITIAYPEIGETSVSYTGFTSEGATQNADGSWTIRLRHGRQIVRMVDAQGNAAYQVMRGRRCHREIVNVTRPGSAIYQPGDQVKIQYSGLFHPANKLAGIYNMSAYVTYNNKPNGTSLIQSASQYTFGSAPAAQAVTVDIPADYDTEAESEIVLANGVLQVNGYGDPIGNHRLIDPEKGRNANFSAIAHKTYFGAIPSISFSVTPYKEFKINVIKNVEDAELTVSFNGAEVAPDEFGLYQGTYGQYDVTASKEGYYCLHQTFEIADDANGLQTFNVVLTEAPEGAWDGVTMTRPATENGAYYITNGAELAWFANQVNTSDDPANATLGADIELANYPWTPAGTSAKKYKSIFNGNGHVIKGLYIDSPKAQYQGLFGYLGGNALITSLTLEGEIHAGDYSGTIAGQLTENALVDRCANYADIYGTQYAGGILGYLNRGGKLTNSYNAGKVECRTYGAGLVGMIVLSEVENLYNIGEVVSEANSSALAGRYSSSTATNVFVNREYEQKEGYTLVSDNEFASGEIAYLLGEAFGQKIGEDSYPQINGEKVYKVAYTLIADEALFDDDSELPVLYTNAILPVELAGEEAHWFKDAEMTEPVTEINEDAELYVKLGKMSGIDNLISDDAAARWYDLRGIEIPEPSDDAVGVFFRVVNGKAEKVIK